MDLNLVSTRPKTKGHIIQDPFCFADIVGYYLRSYGYTPGQLATLSKLPKSTIVNWIDGRVKRPREWQQVLQLGRAMRLTSTEVNKLLAAIGYPTLQELTRLNTSLEEQQLLTFWQESSPLLNVRRTPFQAIPDLPYFVGRHDLIADLSRVLSTSHHKTCYLLHGMGGVGKTALAARLAYLCRANFPDGVLWVRVDTSEPMVALHTIAQAYGQDIQEYNTLDDRSRVVRDLLATKKALMVLDNAQTSEQIRPFLPPTGPCAVLITSRRQDLLVLTGAKRWHVPPFAPADPANQDIFAYLLGESAVSKTADTFRHMAHLLGGLPLALAIVASRLAYEPGWSPIAFSQRLEQTHRRLHELTHEEQSIRISFETSFMLLSEPEQQFFAALSLLGDDFSAQAAAEVTNLPIEETQDFLRHLFRLSLVQVAQPSRFTLHPLLRDFAREQAATVHDLSQWEARYVTYFSRYAQENSADFPALQIEQANILTALEIPTTQKYQQALVEGAKSIAPYLLATGLYPIAASLLERAIAVAQEADYQIDMYILLARVTNQQQKSQTTYHHLETALHLTQPSTHRRAAVLTELGVWAACKHESEIAFDYFKQALQLARQYKYTDLLPTLLIELGGQFLYRGALTEAEEYYTEAMAVAQTLKDTKSIILLHKSLGTLAIFQNNEAQAKHQFRQGLDLARSTLHHSTVLFLANDLGALALKTAEFDAARPLLEEAYLLAQQFGNTTWLCLTGYNLGLLMKLTGEHDKGKQHLQHALITAEKQQVKNVIANATQALTDSYPPPRPIFFI